MITPLVSFCIPTFNRERYLESLLESLCVNLPSFPYEFEIVIADNASLDRTQEVVRGFLPKLPIRYIRHAENIGGFPNFQFVMGQAAGRYVVYLADDDSIMVEHVASTIDKMEADPEIVVVYAPWVMYDLVADKALGQFYNVPRDLRVAPNQHRELLDHLLRHHIFPEVQIVRREVLQRLLPRINEHAFFAFVHAAEYLCQGAVLIQQQPFYVAITNYFADEVRQQLGNEEVEYAWDRYRGGLEYVLARSRDVSTEERIGLQVRIQQMIAMRMSVAIRMRCGYRRNPIDTHMIAMRLRGMGYEALCPVPISQLATEAALHFLLHDGELTRGIREILCIGTYETDVQAYLLNSTKLPLRFASSPPPAEAMEHTLVFTRAEWKEQAKQYAARGVRVMTEGDLMARFPR